MATICVYRHCQTLGLSLSEIYAPFKSRFVPTQKNEDPRKLLGKNKEVIEAKLGNNSSIGSLPINNRNENGHFPRIKTIIGNYNNFPCTYHQFQINGDDTNGRLASNNSPPLMEMRDGWWIDLLLLLLQYQNSSSLLKCKVHYFNRRFIERSQTQSSIYLFQTFRLPEP